MLVIDDEVNGPGLRILTRCLDCGITITTRDIDASLIPAVRAGNIAAGMGEEDGEAWLRHARQRR